MAGTESRGYGSGIFLIIAGSLLLAYKVGAPIPHWLFTWPVLLIAIGLLLGLKSRFRNSLTQYQFARIHRSYIVNTQLITRIEPYEKEGHLVLLNTGSRLPLSKSGYSKLKETLGIETKS